MATEISPPSRLARRLSLGDAVFLGLGSMIGAGIFASAGPAAKAAGSGLLLAVILAAGLSFLNAITMSQLAAEFPESGGTYAYGRKILGPFWGFLAGWGFIVGKIASCTAMALTFAHYFIPTHPKAFALAAVAILTFINLLGIKKTATANKVLVLTVIFTLLLVVIAALAGGNPDISRLKDWDDRGLMGILEATGMMFFAFAGYARVATLGEEVKNPRINIPRAILISLSITLTLYILVIATTALCIGSQEIAAANTPLALAVESGTYAYLSPAVRVGASLASLGVLLSLLAGISRTTFAMAANADLPVWLKAVHQTRKTPWRAELAIGILVGAIVCVADTRSAIGFSSFAILVYYAIANACAWNLNAEARIWPRWLAALGFAACVAVAFSLPKASVFAGILVLAAGVIAYLFRLKFK